MTGDQFRGGIDGTVLCRRLGPFDERLVALPSAQAIEGGGQIAAGLAGLDQRPAGDGELTEIAVHLAHRAGRGLVHLSLSRPTVFGHQLLEHIEHCIRQRLLDRDHGGHEDGMTTERIETGQVLDGDPGCLLPKTRERRGWHTISQFTVDPETADVLHPLDEPHDAARRQGSRRIAQPAEPGEAARCRLT